jgi:hypothetical protein
MGLDPSLVDLRDMLFVVLVIATIPGLLLFRVPLTKQLACTRIEARVPFAIETVTFPAMGILMRPTPVQNYSRPGDSTECGAALLATWRPGLEFARHVVKDKPKPAGNQAPKRALLSLR